jgi:hypothetical protein
MCFLFRLSLAMLLVVFYDFFVRFVRVDVEEMLEDWNCNCFLSVELWRQQHFALFPFEAATPDAWDGCCHDGAGNCFTFL